MGLDLSAWIATGLVGTLVTAASVLVQVVLNKKLRTPADEEVRVQNQRQWEKAAVDERNDILAQVRLNLTEAETRADKLEKRADSLGDKLTAAEDRIRQIERDFTAAESAWLHWGYKAIAAIKRLGGTDEDVPKPTPGKMNLGRTGRRGGPSPK